MKRMFRTLLLSAGAAVLPQAAAAQAAPPIGLWRGLNSGDHMWIQPGGACSVSGTVNVSGVCTWNPTTVGGVLTMTYQWPGGPARIHWSVTWINGSTILVNGVERYPQPRR